MKVNLVGYQGYLWHLQLPYLYLVSTLFDLPLCLCLLKVYILIIMKLFDFNHIYIVLFYTRDFENTFHRIQQPFLLILAPMRACILCILQSLFNHSDSVAIFDPFEDGHAAMWSRNRALFKVCVRSSPLAIFWLCVHLARHCVLSFNQNIKSELLPYTS